MNTSSRPPTAQPDHGDLAASPQAMRRLLRAVRDLAAAHDLTTVVEVVRHAARELVGADGATFVLRDEGFCTYVDEDAIEPLWRGQRFPLTECVSGWSMLHDQMAVIPDIHQDDRVPQGAYTSTFVRSMVMTPIGSPEAIGAIGTYWAAEHTATPDECELLQALADSTGVALESVRILRELEERVSARTAALEASNRDLAAFAQVAAHDLKAPLATIAGYAQLLQEVEAHRLSSVGAGAVVTVRRQASRMNELIDAVLAYSSAATAPLETGPIDFSELTENVLADLNGLIASRDPNIKIGGLPLGWGSGPLIERVLQNLIANAIQYGDQDAPEVHIDGTTTTRTVHVSVSDNGCGVLPQERDSIFEMFTRGRASERSPGSGIGLAFARRVVSRHGGTLTVGDGPLSGACFTLTLPAEGAPSVPSPRQS